VTRLQQGYSESLREQAGGQARLPATRLPTQRTPTPQRPTPIDREQALNVEVSVSSKYTEELLSFYLTASRFCFPE